MSALIGVDGVIASTALALPPDAPAEWLALRERTATPVEMSRKEQPMLDERRHHPTVGRAPVHRMPERQETTRALWEVTFLRRSSPGRAPHIAGRMRIAAPSAVRAREAASEEVTRFADDGSSWSVGLLRPLAPGLPGTHLYRVTFAAWVEEEARYRREDVLATEVWATDAESARRIARQKAEALAAYRGAWRIRRVERLASGREGLDGRSPAVAA